MGLTGGKLLEPSQKQNLCMKHALYGSQNHLRLHSHLPSNENSLAACLGGNTLLVKVARVSTVSRGSSLRHSTCGDCSRAAEVLL
jgi:hypothetical protein